MAMWKDLIRNDFLFYNLLSVKSMLVTDYVGDRHLKVTKSKKNVTHIMILLPASYHFHRDKVTNIIFFCNFILKMLVTSIFVISHQHQLSLNTTDWFLPGRFFTASNLSLSWPLIAFLSFNFILYKMHCYKELNDV